MYCHGNTSAYETDTSFDRCKTDVDDQQLRKRPSMIITDGNVCHAYAFIRQDRCIKVTGIAQQLYISLYDAHSSVHYEVYCRQLRASLTPQNWEDCNKARHTELSHVSESLLRVIKPGLFTRHVKPRKEP